MRQKRIIFITATLTLMTFAFCLNASANEWKKEISLGYNQSNGNTDNAQFNINGAVKYLLTDAEFSSAIDIYYSETNDKMDTQKWTSLTRYHYDFGEAKVWFNSYQLEIMHDYFADVDYRITPAVGLGYWFSKEEDWKAMLEGSLGYETTEYRTAGLKGDEEMVFIAHTFLKKQILEKAFASEDFSLIPSLADSSFRLKSETAFTNPISEGLDLSVKFIVDYNSDPAGDKKKTDTRFITALKYLF